MAAASAMQMVGEALEAHGGIDYGNSRTGTTRENRLQDCVRFAVDSV